VVAGVIGRKKFIYDLWGATVNLASRMESHGQSGVVQITRSTYDLVGAEFECESARTIQVKGAGAVEVWRVTGRKAGPRPAGRDRGGRTFPAVTGETPSVRRL
jgi:adenylate cyclase